MTSSANKIDVAIVGGGIVGLWSAYTILKKSPELIVVVFEAEGFLGEHCTGRNSEVLHSGLYYPTNSLKHYSCLEGNLIWREYIREKTLTFLDCGKIIAANSNQLEKLESLYKLGEDNQVLGLRRLEKYELSSLQNKLHMADGFFISSSGVLNVSESIVSLRNEIEALGGIILTKNKVELINFSNEKFSLEVNEDSSYSIEAKILVNAAGLHAINFRKQLGLHDFENYYVKGSYLKLTKKLDFSQLIYPIPPLDGLGLGVHLTMDTAGGQKFGPDTEIVGGIDYSLNETVFEKMMPAISKVFKNICESDLQLGYAGIRPKIKKNGKLAIDFMFNTQKEHGIKGYFEFLGIESPGVTAAPSLAKKLSSAINL
jgi:L-2-hydroxyglutarate oxidase LhgO